MGRVQEWQPDALVANVVPADEEGWRRIRAFYAPDRDDEPLDQLIRVAQGNGVESIVIERRYIDPDYRSEHARFYSSTFQRHPNDCHRLHFFTTPPSEVNLASLQSSEYEGYSVMRPLTWAPVGRTMIKPPQELVRRGASFCTSKDRVRPFGCLLEIEAVPFVSQDAQYSSCAHASQWMVLYHAHLQYLLARQHPGDIHDASLGGDVRGRQVPSEGLSLGQLLTGLQKLGLSAGPIPLPPRPDDEDDDSWRDERTRGLGLTGVLCAYVNSQMPPIVTSGAREPNGTKGHTWVVAGYVERQGALPMFVVHDDQLGPYVQVDDPWSWRPRATVEDGQRGNVRSSGEAKEQPILPWEFAIPPHPQRLYVTAPVAITYARTRLADYVQRHWRSGGEIEYRAYAMRSRVFKEGLARRRHHLPEDVAKAYHLALLPGFVWVVEAIDVGRQPAVVGEALLDSTAHEPLQLDAATPMVLSLHAAGMAEFYDPDFPGVVPVVAAEGFNPYSSGCLNASW